MKNEEIKTDYEKMIRQIRVLSGLSFLFAFIGLIVRIFASPTYVVANPPDSNASSWEIGFTEMYSTQQLAAKEQKTEEEIIALIVEGRIKPAPLRFQQKKVMWAVDKNYKIVSAEVAKAE